MERFLEAQAYMYSVAYKEIKNGFKQSHWMWFIFPQIYGLGFSSISQKYELKSFDEAREYFNHELLRSRLLEISQAVYDLNAEDIEYVMGYPDDLKLQSCMTLFALIAPEHAIFQKVLDRYYKGEMCEYTATLFKHIEGSA